MRLTWSIAAVMALASCGGSSPASPPPEVPITEPGAVSNPESSGENESQEMLTISNSTTTFAPDPTAVGPPSPAEQSAPSTTIDPLLDQIMAGLPMPPLPTVNIPTPPMVPPPVYSPPMPPP